MTTSIMSDAEPGPLRIAISARLIPTLSYMIAPLGAAVSALMVTNDMRAMRLAASAGLSAVTGGLAESCVPVLIALYLAIVSGVAGIVLAIVRLNMQTKTASPPAWFFVASGVLVLAPVALLWQGQSVLIDALAPGSGGIARVASTIEWLVTLAMIAAPIVMLLLLAASVLPISTRAKPTFWPLVVLIAIELVLIFAVIAFHLRISWLHDVTVTGRL